MVNDTIEPLLLSVKDVGLLLGCGLTKTHELISSGKLPPSFKLGGSRKFRRTDIEKWIDLGMPSIDKFEKIMRYR